MSVKRPEEFGYNAFNPFKYLLNKTNQGHSDSSNLTPDQIDIIAQGAFEWAKAKGVKSYTFWIQPQNGETIEKHEQFHDFEYAFKGFISYQSTDKFDGTILLRGEGDGSSVPSGGLRATERSRAYFVWETKSDLFIRETKNGKVLYIPGMFLTYFGDALDEKTYLLRAEKTLKENVINLLAALGNKQVKEVMFALGIEQEFFIIRKRDFESRIDLKETGRVLYGRDPPHDQEFSDHYFGKLNPKILEILNEVEAELSSVGVALKTKHKEVAINQYEIACCFQNASTSVNHNMVLMDVLRTTFDRHGYTVMFHEKPYGNANGSGKHCNWSVLVNNGEKWDNLFEPSHEGENRTRFLLFVLMTLKAVMDNAGLLKATVTSSSNDLRMGGHEAPPMIISVFLGQFICNLLESVEKGEGMRIINNDLETRIPGISHFMQDNTDRNRTSPFAFTGNKFQFRAVGGKMNVSFSMAVVAAILAKQISNVTEQINNGGKPEDIIKRLISETKNIRFEGNGYSKDWEIEAGKRGLPHLKTALDSFREVRNSQVLKDTKVFNEAELEAKYKILMGNYIHAQIAEGKTMEIILKQNFLPRLIYHLKNLAALGQFSRVTQSQTPIFEDIYLTLREQANKLTSQLKSISSSSSLEDRMTSSIELKSLLDHISDILSDAEIELPPSKHSPQLVDMLNTYY